jgi:hypothetical protein
MVHKVLRDVTRLVLVEEFLNHPNDIGPVGRGVALSAILGKVYNEPLVVVGTASIFLEVLDPISSGFG